jgi:hypothetical protein
MSLCKKSGKTHFCQNLYIYNFLSWKHTNMWTTSDFFLTAQSKQSANRRKFAQPGHPVKTQNVATTIYILVTSRIMVKLQGLMLWSQFSAIFNNFWQKIGVSLHKTMLWSKFCIINFDLRQQTPFFGENIFKIIAQVAALTTDMSLN